MKFIIRAVVAAVFVVPAVSFAQSNQPVTRAQVRAELVQLEQTGWRPGNGDHTTYPVQIQAAEAKAAAENGETGVGGVASVLQRWRVLLHREPHDRKRLVRRRP